MRYAWIVLIWLIVYALSVLTKTSYPDNELFYAVNSTWSLLLIWAFFMVERSKLTFSLAFMEMAAILLHIAGCLAMMFDYQIIYKNYNSMLVFINIVEVILITRKAPWSGILDNTARILSISSYYLACISGHRFSTKGSP